MRNIVYSAMRTPDGALLESIHRHDYVTHIDDNGKIYMLDGGLDYVRCSANGDEDMVTITLDDPHEVVREYCQWGTYGKDGGQPLKYLKLKDMSDNHIAACLENAPHMNEAINQAMINEQEYRRNDTTNTQ